MHSIGTLVAAILPLAVSPGAALTSAPPADSVPIDVGDRVQPIVDRHLVAEMDGVELRLATPHDEGEVFRFDRPWEGAFCAYATVITDGDRHLLYYRGLPESGKDGTTREVTCVATSDDGIEWRRPMLAFFEIDGEVVNNVVLADAAPVTHNFSPFLDTRPGVPADERFKALGGSERSGLIAYVSGDGMAWRRLQDERKRAREEGQTPLVGSSPAVRKRPLDSRQALRPAGGGRCGSRPCPEAGWGCGATSSGTPPGTRSSR